MVWTASAILRSERCIRGCHAGLNHVLKLDKYNISNGMYVQEFINNESLFVTWIAKFELEYTMLNKKVFIFVGCRFITYLR